jgi:hypothetical protein
MAGSSLLARRVACSLVSSIAVLLLSLIVVSLSWIIVVLLFSLMTVSLTSPLVASSASSTAVGSYDWRQYTAQGRGSGGITHAFFRLSLNTLIRVRGRGRQSRRVGGRGRALCVIVNTTIRYVLNHEVLTTLSSSRATIWLISWAKTSSSTSSVSLATSSSYSALCSAYILLEVGQSGIKYSGKSSSYSKVSHAYIQCDN